MTESTSGDGLLRTLFDEGIAVSACNREEVIARAATPEMAAELRALFDTHDQLPPEPLISVTPALDPERLVGATLGEFQVISYLASGGTADVYVGAQRSPAREVVLKVRRAIHGTSGQLERFLQEAERLAHFSHPGVAHIYGSGVELLSGKPVTWIAMERIDGLPLREWRDASPRLLRERCSVLSRVAEIVAAAHTRGLVHRDISPRNIVVDRDGLPRVMDFGIARTLHQVDDRPTIEGTLGFASPEQEAGHPADRADDVVALGKLAEWLVPNASPGIQSLAARATGSAPDRPSAAEMAASFAHLARAPRWPGALAVVASLVLATVGVWYVTETSARAKAVQAAAEAKEREEALAMEAHARQARAEAKTNEITKIMAALMDASGKFLDTIPGTTPSDALAKAQAAVLDAQEASSAVRWRALEQIATAWRNLGRFDDARDAGLGAASIADTDPDALRMYGPRLRAWAVVMAASGSDLNMARVLLSRSVDELQHFALEIGDGASLPVGADKATEGLHANYAQALGYLSNAASVMGELDQAAYLAELAGPFHRTGVLSGGRLAVSYLVNTARLESRRENHDAAVALASEGLELSSTVNRDDALSHLNVRTLHASVLEAAGRPTEATTAYVDALEQWTLTGGPVHPKTISALTSVGLNAHRCREHDRAVTLLRDAVERGMSALGDRNPATVVANIALARALQGAGGHDIEILELTERVLPIASEINGSPGEWECVLMTLRANSLAKAGRREDALHLIADATARARQLRDGGVMAKKCEDAQATISAEPAQNQQSTPER